MKTTDEIETDDESEQRITDNDGESTNFLDVDDILKNMDSVKVAADVISRIRVIKKETKAELWERTKSFNEKRDLHLEEGTVQPQYKKEILQNQQRIEALESASRELNKALRKVEELSNDCKIAKEKLLKRIIELDESLKLQLKIEQLTHQANVFKLLGKRQSEIDKLMHEAESLKKLSDSSISVTVLGEGKQVNNCLKKIDKLEKLIKRLRTSQSADRALIERLKVEIKSLKDEIESLKFEIKSLKDERESLNDQVSDLDKLVHQLTAESNRTKDELLAAQDESLEGVREHFTGTDDIGIKLMGQLDEEPFVEKSRERFSDDEYFEKASQGYILWRTNLLNPLWRPFKISCVQGKDVYVIDEKDTKLKELKMEWGTKVYEAVKQSLMEIIEYNPSGSYLTEVLWNFKEKRKANLAEVISLAFKHLAHLR